MGLGISGDGAVRTSKKLLVHRSDETLVNLPSMPLTELWMSNKEEHLFTNKVAESRKHCELQAPSLPLLLSSTEAQRANGSTLKDQTLIPAASVGKVRLGSPPPPPIILQELSAAAPGRFWENSQF